MADAVFMAELPECVRAAILCDLLPEVLHDLNNECSAVEGLSLLLHSEARDATKIGERARRLRDCAANLERAAWISHVASAMLGAPLSLQSREEGFSWFCETAASSIERRGGSFEAELAGDPPAASPLLAPLQIGWFFALVRALAGRSPAKLRLVALGPGSVRVFAEGGEPDEGFAEAVGAARALGLHLEAAPGTPRSLVLMATQP